MATAAVRNREIAKIKIAVKQLGMDDATYRDMLFTVARVRSAANLDWTGRKQVIDHLKSRGAKIGWQGKPAKPSSTNAALIAKIGAQLAEMGLPWEYAQGMARHMFKLAKLEWCKAEQLHKIVAALAYEQEKRTLLAEVDRMLQIAGKTRADITAHNRGNPDWTRNKQVLTQAIALMPIWWPGAFVGQQTGAAREH